MRSSINLSRQFIAKRVNELLQDRQITTYEVEKKTGYSSAALVELKNGKKDCRLSTIINLCDALDITVEEFFAGATFKI